MQKTVLLTGGAGFIGSHIAERLLEEAYKVVIVDDLSYGSLENLKRIRHHENLVFCQIDITQKDALEQIFKEYRPSIINHHAAQKSIPHSVENPLLDLHINGKGLLNLIELAGKYQVESFLFASTGGALCREIEEGETSAECDSPLMMSPYAVTKFAGEQYIRIYAKQYGFNYIILRYANVYGPRQIADGECGVVPIFLDHIFANKDSVLMTYEDMPKGCTRDYVYISDVVHANMLGMRHMINDVVNIGSGKETYIMDIYQTIKEVFDTPYNIKVVGPRKGDVKRSALNVDKAQVVLGWRPTVGLKEGLRELKNYIDQYGR